MPRIVPCHSVSSVGLCHDDDAADRRSLRSPPAGGDPVRASALPALARFFFCVLRAKPGEHSFAEEAKVANYRETSREGGLMRRSPMTGHIRSPLFAPVPRAAMPGDDSTLASKSTDRCVNPITDAFVSVPASLSFSLPLSFRSSRLLSPSIVWDSPLGSLLLPASGYHRSSLTVCTVSNLVREIRILPPPRAQRCV